MAAPSIFNRGSSSGLSPSFGPLYQGSAGGSSPAARPSGRSWLDPERMEERLLRRQDRQSRMGGGGGGGGQQAPLAPLPEGVQQTNATTGQVVTILPQSITSDADGSAARRYGTGRLAALGERPETQVNVYDPRTGLSQTLTPQMAMQRGLLGSAQRALLQGLNRGQTFSRTNPFF